MTVPRSHGPRSIDGSALGRLIEASGLFDRGLATQAGALGGRFPASVQRNIFLEFELATEAIAGGFGLGFEAGQLDYYKIVRDPFLDSVQGLLLQAALIDDPFAADHRQYLNLQIDGDPDWFEFDVADGCIDTTPFVFFRIPSRFGVIASLADVHELCAVLPGRAIESDFARLLGRLVALGPARPYRIGVARSRGPGWWRPILTNLSLRQVEAALAGLTPDNFDSLLGPVARLYDRAMDSPGACFALSIDVQDDRITAVDVECPYLFRIAEPAARAGPTRAYTDELTAAGLISEQTATWIRHNVLRTIDPDGVNSTLRIMLHHLKFRLYGQPRPRVKAYLLLDLAERPGKGARR